MFHQDSLEIIYEEFNDKWYNALNVSNVISKKSLNLPYQLKLTSDESVNSNSYFTELNKDAYYVLVKYNQFVRYELRIFKNNVDKIVTRGYLDKFVIVSDKPQDKIKITDDPSTIDGRSKLITSCNELGDRNKAIEIYNKSVEPLGNKFCLYESLYKPDFEYSVANFYNNNKDEASLFQDKVMINRITPKNQQEGYLRNVYNFYQHNKLPLKRYKQLTVPCMNHYTVMNSAIIQDNGQGNGKSPSTIKDEPSFVLSVRTVNYFHVTPNYISNDADRHIRTETYLCKMDTKLELTKKLRIFSHVDYIKHRKTMVTCIEDMRVFYYKNRYWTIGTGIDTHYQRSHQMVLSRLKVDFQEESAITDKMYMLDYGSWKVQKNWIPFIFSDKLTIIYKYEPFTILEVNVKTGKCSIFKEVTQKIDCSTFRGSTVPFKYSIAGKYGTTYVMLVHTSRWLNGRNTYTQRFIEFDEHFVMVRTSPYFKITEHHMEYVMGCGYDYNTKEIYISLSENDLKGAIATISVDTFESMMYEI